MKKTDYYKKNLQEIDTIKTLDDYHMRNINILQIDEIKILESNIEFLKK